MATISRLLKIIGLFCRIWSLLQGSFVKETYNFKEPTNRSHPIANYFVEQKGGEKGGRDTKTQPPSFTNKYVSKLCDVSQGRDDI